jgi:hypothetical protein
VCFVHLDKHTTFGLTEDAHLTRDETLQRVRRIIVEADPGIVKEQAITSIS